MAATQSASAGKLAVDDEAQVFAEWQTTRDESIRTRLIAHLMSWAAATIRSRYSSHSDIDELKSIANEAISRAFDSFDPTKGASLLTHARWHIESGWKQHFRGLRRLKRDARLVDECSDELEYKLASNEPDPEDMAIESQRKSSMRSAIAKAMQSLTPAEQEIIRLRYWNGDNSPTPCKEVGEQLRRGRETIRTEEIKALVKIRAALGPNARMLLEVSP